VQSGPGAPQRLYYSVKQEKQNSVVESNADQSVMPPEQQHYLNDPSGKCDASTFVNYQFIIWLSAQQVALRVAVGYFRTGFFPNVQFYTRCAVLSK